MCDHSATDTPSLRQGILRGVIIALATGGGVGFAPKAPGTFGSILGVLLFLLFFRLSFASLIVFSLFLLTTTAIGIWAAERGGEMFGNEDDGRIVIDEVVGQLLTLTPLFACGCMVQATENPFFFSEPKILLWVVTGFVLFRVFDIWKPGPVRWAEQRLPGGVGVMMDDIVAGALGALSLGILLFIARAIAAPFALSLGST